MIISEPTIQALIIPLSFCPHLCHLLDFPFSVPLVIVIVLISDNCARIERLTVRRNYITALVMHIIATYQNEFSLSEVVRNL